MACKVSVVIPFYNGIAYLQECVASVQNQTLREIEILLVDDGSTDGSGQLADALAAEDCRIRVLHQENQGVSAARNAALDVAQGEYIGFVDADDCTKPEMYEVLYQTAKTQKCDVVSSAFFSFDETGVIGQSRPPTVPNTVMHHEDILQQIPTMSTSHTFHFIWRRLFSAALIRNNAIRFEEGISIGEDTLFCMECFLHAERTISIEKCLYMYRHQPNSALRKKTYKPNLLASLAAQYEKKYAVCSAYCPQQVSVFLKDSAKRSVSDTFPLVLANIFRKPEHHYKEYRALLRTKWAKDTLRYATIPHTKSLDHIALYCMQKGFFFLGFCIARHIYGKDKSNG